MNDIELTHHGIKGMRWGVRRTEKQLARARGESTVKKQTSSASTKASSTSTSAKGSAKKETDNDAEEQVSTKTLKDRNERLRLEKEYKSMLMSDDDLQQRINRLKLEKEYAQLTAKEKSAGRKLVGEVLHDVIKTTATNFGKQALGNLINKAMSKINAKTDKTESFGPDDYTIFTPFRENKRGTSGSSDSDFIYADFEDISYNAGKSYFDDIFSNFRPYSPALSAPKDDKD